MRILYPLLLACLYVAAMAQHHSWTPAGADVAGRGFTALTQENVFAAQNNPALLAVLPQASVGGYLQRSFLLAGLDRVVVGATLPLSQSGFGLSASYFGYTAYNEQQVRVGYGRLLAESLSMGVSFTYLNTGMGEYGRASGVTFEAGILYQASDQIRLAAHIVNPLSITMGLLEEPVPALIQTGIRCASSDQVRFYAEVSQQLDRRPRLRGGMEYQPLDWLTWQVGTTTQPVQFTAGLGLHRTLWDIHISYAWHQLLGNTPLFHVSYNLSEKENSQ